MTSHPEFVQRRKHIDRKLFLLDSPFLRLACSSLCQTGAQVAQPQTSFWPDGGRGKAAPEALRGIPHGTPIGGPAPPGQKRAGVRCTALTYRGRLARDLTMRLGRA